MYRYDALGRHDETEQSFRYHHSIPHEKLTIKHVSCQNVFGNLFDGLLHQVVVEKEALGRHDEAVQSYRYHHSILHEKLD